jgi:uncharacterized protein with HEPN domain
MKLEARKLLFDVDAALQLIEKFRAGRGFDDFRADAMFRSAVERQFIIVGEALSQLAKLDRGVFDRIPQAAEVIAFRNQLVHGYQAIDDLIVWGIVEADADDLRAVVNVIAREPVED